MDQITNRAITRFYGVMDPDAPWDFLKIRETCHPYTPYVAQALLQKHLSDELVDMVLVFYDEAQVREWRWKRTEAFVRHVFRHSPSGVADVMCVSVKEEKITDVYQIWVKIRDTTTNLNLTPAMRDGRYKEDMMPFMRATGGAYFESLLYTMDTWPSMSPNPQWFVNGPSGPANLYYAPTPQPSPLFTPSPVYSHDSEPEQ